MKKNQTINFDSSIQKYARCRKDYKKLADFLQEVLGNICKKNAPTAIIQTRAKTVSSFTKKIIIRNIKKNPFEAIYDLCGCRIITPTQSDAMLICKEIEALFDTQLTRIKQGGSELNISEFGYRSHHYNLSFNREDVNGLKVPSNLHHLHAEIQVRTFLEHAWAEFTHDRFYKTDLLMPVQWQRELARIAALFESADNDFDTLTNAIDPIKKKYTAFMDDERLKQEFELMKEIHKHEPNEDNKPEHAFKLAQIATLTCTNEYLEVGMQVLKQHLKNSPKNPKNALIEIEYGRLCCLRYWQEPGNRIFNSGQQIFTKYCGLSEKSLNAILDKKAKWEIHSSQYTFSSTALKALSLLAWTYNIAQSNEIAAHRLYSLASMHDLKNPYLYSMFMEYELGNLKKNINPALLASSINSAIETCNYHINLEVEFPDAYFAKARLLLFKGDQNACLENYLKAFHSINTSGREYSILQNTEEKLSIKRIAKNPAYSVTANYLEQMLVLDKATHANNQLARPTDFALNIKEPVLLIAGGADHLEAEFVDELKAMLHNGLADFSGTIITGCTNSGVVGWVAELASQLNKQKKKHFKLIGYRPEQTLKKYRTYDQHFDQVIKTKGTAYTVQEPLQIWTNLMESDLSPEDITLLGVNGGFISKFEYQLALELGATVALVSGSGRSADELLSDDFWSTHPHLIALPKDKMTLWAFVNQEVQTTLTEEQIEKAAAHVHEHYRKIKKINIEEPAIFDWEKLPEKFKHSNRNQIEFMAAILNHFGYRIAAKDSKAKAVQAFKEKEVLAMAEMEHGRWNAERLRQGWRYGAKTDKARYIHQDILPWNLLPENTKVYDIEAVNEWPDIVQEAGFKIVQVKGYK